MRYYTLKNMSHLNQHHNKLRLHKIMLLILPLKQPPLMLRLKITALLLQSEICSQTKLEKIRKAK